MSLRLFDVLNSQVPLGCKGLPQAASKLRIKDVPAQRWNLLDGDLPTPVALIGSRALDNNLTEMQTYFDRARVCFAPHGKTTMCPQLYERQLDAGAWGITVATYAQLRVALAVGVRRILIANELVSVAEIEGLAELQAGQPEAEIYSLIDSVAGLDRLQEILHSCGATRPARVLIEVGFRGGRCGCRAPDLAIEIARKCNEMPLVSLCGIEGYEGLIIDDGSDTDAIAVDTYLEMLVGVLRACLFENLFEVGVVLLSAGGSTYFDLVALAISATGDSRVVPVVRSGCYVTHDCGFYATFVARAAERNLLGCAPQLQPALEVWTQVLSRPEPGLAILNAGKRDVSYDIDLPVPRRWFRLGAREPSPLESCDIFKLSDQHAFMRVQADRDIRVGDFVGLGISHPCTTFDKWPVLLEVSDTYDVIAALRTFF
jgi:D-serine dehydratase